MQQHMTLLLLIQQLLHKSAELRPYAFSRLFPDRDIQAETKAREERNEAVPMEYDAVDSSITESSAKLLNLLSVPDKSSNTVGNRLVKLMTSLDQSLQYVVTELIFQLCGEDGATY